MLGLIKFLITLPLTLVVLLWAVSNTTAVEWSFSPLNDPMILPLGTLIFGVFVFGFLMGSLLLWLNALPSRLKAGQLKKDNKAYEKNLARLGSENGPLAGTALPKQ